MSIDQIGPIPAAVETVVRLVRLTRRPLTERTAQILARDVHVSPLDGMRSNRAIETFERQLAQVLKS